MYYVNTIPLFCIIFSEPSIVEEDKRGFRSGASDRFSHGFGKRTPEIE